jgi:uncharacterized protein YyaL (SSP411 family)
MSRKYSSVFLGSKQQIVMNWSLTAWETLSTIAIIFKKLYYFFIRSAELKITQCFILPMMFLSKYFWFHPLASSYYWYVLHQFKNPSQRVVLVGADSYLLHAVHSEYQPNKVVFSNDGPVDKFAKSLRAQDAPMVFLCTGSACLPPTNHIKEIKRMLCEEW